MASTLLREVAIPRFVARAHASRGAVVPRRLRTRKLRTAGERAKRQGLIALGSSSTGGSDLGQDPVAEEVGFEPTEGCPSHDFQSCRFGRSRTPPGDACAPEGPGYLSRAKRLASNLVGPRSAATVGSRATVLREPSQGWKPAALSGRHRVPRFAWSSRRLGLSRAVVSMTPCPTAP